MDRPLPDTPSFDASTLDTPRLETPGLGTPGLGMPGMGMPAAVDARPADPHEGVVYRVRRPSTRSLPIVLASPHSGRDYSADFLAGSRLDPRKLRRSEDCFVDEIFAPAVDLGAPMLEALFPRAYLDPNREPYELDPEMFEGPVPAYVNSRSPRVAAGLGTIARIVASGEEIYRGKLPIGEAMNRVRDCYHPYHAALRGLIDETRSQFGYCVLLDCHSMPSIGLPPEMVAGSRVDMILGDCFGTACAEQVTEAAEAALRRLGYTIARNAPYAGGYTTKHYGRPRDGVHAIQIEINRSLYMDETTFTRRPFLGTLAQHMQSIVAALARVPPGFLAARAR